MNKLNPELAIQALVTDDCAILYAVMQRFLQPGTSDTSQTSTETDKHSGAAAAAWMRWCFSRLGYPDVMCGFEYASTEHRYIPAVKCAATMRHQVRKQQCT